jgi:hypothetical protein
MFMKLKQVSFKIMKARRVVYMLKGITTYSLQYIHDEPKISPIAKFWLLKLVDTLELKLVCSYIGVTKYKH